MPTERGHGKFQRILRNSGPAVEYVAQWLRSRDNDVLVMPTTIAPTHAEWAQHTDSGDMRIVNKAGLKLNGEVKEITKHKFTATDGHPYPHRVFIDNVRKYNAKSPKPHWYYLISGCWRTIVAVDCADDASWFEADVKDECDLIWKPTWCTTIDRCKVYDLTKP